jgi:hypothetical protein
MLARLKRWYEGEVHRIALIASLLVRGIAPAVGQPDWDYTENAKRTIRMFSDCLVGAALELKKPGIPNRLIAERSFDLCKVEENQLLLMLQSEYPRDAMHIPTLVAAIKARFKRDMIEAMGKR